MTLDERSPIVEHRELRDDEAEWVAVARRTEADDLERRRLDAVELDEIESPEAEHAKWHHPTHGIFALMRRDRPAVHYDESPGYDRRMFAVDGARDVDLSPPVPFVPGGEG
jgi:hypothetical protein